MLLRLSALCLHANRQLAVRAGPPGAERTIELARAARSPSRPPAGTSARDRITRSSARDDAASRAGADVPSRVRVEFGSAGGWDVVFADQAQRLACDTLDQASRIAHVFAQARAPCELIIVNAYGHVISHELVPL